MHYAIDTLDRRFRQFRQKDRQTDRQTDSSDRKTDRQTVLYSLINKVYKFDMPTSRTTQNTMSRVRFAKLRETFRVREEFLTIGTNFLGKSAQYFFNSKHAFSIRG